MTDGPSLLLVEDEALLLLSMSEVLADGGFALLEATSGHAAIEHLDGGGEIHGLVTDIRAGAGPNGWDIARHARKLFPTIAVVYVTGDSFAEWSAEGVPDSVILQKPFADAQLVTAISTLLNCQPPAPPTPSPG